MPYFRLSIGRLTIVVAGYPTRVVLAGIGLTGLLILLWLLRWQY